jgi:radical SAM protein with 4Fe4S-binding SPASM domain
MQYKVSKFIKNYKIEDFICLYHTLSQEVLFVKNNIYEKDFIDKLTKQDPKLFNLMKKLKFVVSSDKEDANVLKKVVQEKKKYDNKYSLLRILMTDHCNLNCKYCKVENNIVDRQSATVSTDDLIKTLKLFQKVSPKRKKLVSITGGEPLLFPEKVKEIVELSKTHLDNCWIILFTNAILVDNDMAKYLRKEKVSIVISLDGGEKTHNKLRVFYNGEGSYNKVMAGYALLRKNKCKIGFSCTAGKHNINNLVEEMIFIMKNFKPESLGINPLKYPSHKTTNFSHLTSPVKYAQQLFGLYREAAKNGIFVEQIYRKIAPFVEKRFKYYDCGACGKNINLDVRGNLGPCKSFLILKTLYQNNKDSLNPEVFGKPLTRSTLNNEKCLECEALGICGGGCAYESFVEVGKYDEISERGCLISKTLLSQLMNYLYELNKKEISVGIKSNSFYYISNSDRDKIYGKIKTKQGTLAYSVGHVV